MGPAVSIAVDRRTGTMSSTYLNDPDGSIPANLNSLLDGRLDGARDLDYIRTRGAGSHSEIYAVNELLNNGADIGDIAVLTEFTQLSRGGQVFPACPHCDHILDGVTYITD